MKKVGLMCVCLMLIMTVSLTGGVEAQEDRPRPDGPWITPDQEVKLERFIQPEELVEKLYDIEDRARDGRMEVEVIGESAGYDYPIQVVKFGDAGENDAEILIDTQIHGDEAGGTEAAVELIKELAMGDSNEVRKILDNVTVWFVPMLNADGATIVETDRGQAMSRINVQEWEPEEWDLDEDAPAPWYHDEECGVTGRTGYDINRDFHPDLDFELGPEYLDKLEEQDRGYPGFYATLESRALRSVYSELEPDLYINHHHRYSNKVSEDDDRLATLQIIGQVIDKEYELEHEGETYTLSEDSLELSKQVNSLVYKSLQKGNSPFGAITKYPDVHIPGTALGSFSLNDSAIMLYETRGQQHPYGHTGQKASGMYIRQSYEGLYETLLGFANGDVYEIDPDFYDEEIPPAGPWVGDPF